MMERIKNKTGFRRPVNYISSKQANGLKPKDLVGIPWMLAFALRADGWYLRCDIIFSKSNPMPESVLDRPTRSHEYLFLLSKSRNYYYDANAIKEPASEASLARWAQDIDSQAGSLRVPGKTKGPMKAVGGPRLKIPSGWDTGPGAHDAKTERYKNDKQRGHSRRHDEFNDRWDQMERTEQCSGMRNKRSVWTLATSAFKESHFATFPEKLIEPCILAGSPQGGVVLDPFMGAGTTALVALKLNRKFLGIELNASYIEMANRRIAPEFAQGKLL